MTRLRFGAGFALAVLLAGTSGAPAMAQAATVRNDTAATRALVHRWLDVGNTLQADKLATIMADDVVMYQPQNPKPLAKADIIKFFTMLWKAYPDMHFESVGITAEGNEAASWERVTGTLKNSYTDPSSGRVIQPTGKSFDVYAAIRLTFNQKGQISQVRIFWDRLDFMTQLGLR